MKFGRRTSLLPFFCSSSSGTLMKTWRMTVDGSWFRLKSSIPICLAVELTDLLKEYFSIRAD
jgi:hypothetical protein